MLVVPGIIPLGCVLVILSSFRSSVSDEDYDPDTGCIRWLNDFSERHNEKLLEAINRIRIRHPYATIVYADYFYAALSILRSPRSHGFRGTPLEACCGGGGDYNYNASAPCGSPNAGACDDPSAYFCWDGAHLTDAAYKSIADGVLYGPVRSIFDDCQVG